MQSNSWNMRNLLLPIVLISILNDVAISQGLPPTNSDESSIRIAGNVSVQNGNFDPAYGIRSTDTFQPNAIGYNNRSTFNKFDGNLKSGDDQLNIYHQPLIQIKLRIIEIVREDNFNAKTILDYIRDQGSTSRINNHNINQNRERTTTSTRFPTPRLVGIDLGQPGGGIVNLTSNNLNLIGEFLATEFKADLVTCPQVVTLNGQRVHLVSGANVPFQLGQSVIQDGAVQVQETFYKHVGTNLIVTPRIINWGPRGEGVGKRPITSQDIRDWNSVAGMMDFENLWFGATEELKKEEKDVFKPYVGTSRLMTTDHQRMLLDSLNRHDRTGLIAMLNARQQIPGYRYHIETLFYPLDCDSLNENGCPCNWKPSDCTLDIEVILRQSDAKSDALIANLASATNRQSTTTTNEEKVGAAISDVIQLKSGHGAVIAGLIGERDIQAVSKVPVLGDIPYVGAAFRSKSTNRQKTEIVIFLEAEILPSEALEKISNASQDFELTKAYANGDVLSNPLEAGMQRVGFGSYLPPRSHQEKIYWERLGRKVQKSSTDVSDIVR